MTKVIERFSTLVTVGLYPFPLMLSFGIDIIVLADLTTIFGYCPVNSKKGIAKGLLGLTALCLVVTGGLVYDHVVVVSHREAKRKIHPVPVEMLSLPVTVS